jgi:hypothetical protein
MRRDFSVLELMPSRLKSRPEEAYAVKWLSAGFEMVLIEGLFASWVREGVEFGADKKLLC